MDMTLYPLLFEPIYKDYIWGGGRIPGMFGRSPRPGATCAESWEITDRPEGISIVSNGPARGASLHKLVETMGTSLTGTSSKSGHFPLLIKIIDAKERLSVQVHPDEHTAALCGGEPKTEMWYVLGAEHGARIFAGVKAGTTSDSFTRALEKKQIEELLPSMKAEIGNAVYVPGGRLHAIGEGCLLLEVQQNSDTTYRVYDWGRAGKDGKPRELHIEKALKVINWKDNVVTPIKPGKPAKTGSNSFSEIVRCPFFVVTRLDLTKQETITNDGRSFHALFTVSGEIDVEGNGIRERLGPGTSCLLPAALNSYTITPVQGSAAVIRTSLV